MLDRNRRVGSDNAWAGALENRGAMTVAKSDKTSDTVNATERDDQPEHEIQRFHELGCRVLEKAAKDRSDVAAAACAVGELEGVSVDRARKAALFARRFPSRSLGWLCRLKSPDGTPLSVNHVRRILKVKNLGEWRSWFERAAKGGWSANRLNREIRQSVTTAPGLGADRRSKNPETCTKLLDQLSEWTEMREAGRILTTSGVETAAWPPATGLGDAEPAILLARLREVRKDLARLRQGAEILEDRLKHGREERSRRAGRPKGEKAVNGNGDKKA